MTLTQEGKDWGQEGQSWKSALGLSDSLGEREAPGGGGAMKRPATHLLCEPGHGLLLSEPW